MKTELTKQNTLIAVAMEEEFGRELANDWRVVYTGIGKVNALISISRALREERPSNIINFGTAGSSEKGLHGFHEVTSFKQRDMDLRDLGLPLGATLHDEIGDIKLDRPGLSCGTGDSFVTSTQEMNTDLYDMEAYAIAKLCMIEKINFLCFKYISDQANETASNDWNQNISNAGEAFRIYLESLNG